MRKKFMTNAEIMAKAEAEIAGTLHQVRGDNTRTEAYKKGEVAKAYQQMRAVRDRLVAERDAQQATYRRTLERDVFAGRSDNDPSWAISRRDASDRADQLESEAQATQLLERAERQGDEPLARAVVEKAYQHGWADVANRFVESHPAVADRFQELWEHREPSLQESVLEGLVLQGRPAELAGMSDIEINHWARGFEAQQEVQSTAKPTQAELNRRTGEQIRASEAGVSF